jgi:ribose 5-phosphate isomerase B
VGTHENSSCHYPDFAEKIGTLIKPEDRAIVVCGSGIGIGIAMVKSGISCATVWN